MTVTATIAWRLVDAASGTVVYSKALKSLGSASLDDAADNGPRLRIADQRAVRANLQQLVQDLAALPAR
jgi:ABC-type oligopeptide transport system ATPase subunit